MRNKYFNIDFMIDSFYVKKLQITILNMDMKQYVDKRELLKHSRTIIDLIFSNKKLKVHVIYKPKITDHAWLKNTRSVC